MRQFLGLHLANPKPESRISDYPGITFCGRFNFKRLLHEFTQALWIETPWGEIPRYRVFHIYIGSLNMLMT